MLTGHVEHRPLRLVVLGDSLAYGTGAQRLEDTVGAQLATVLDHHGHDVELHVLAVPGATSHDLATQVRRAVQLGAHLALIVVGANDLARFITPERSAAALRVAVDGLRNGGATVVITPAPDLSAVHGVPPTLRAALRTACLQLQLAQTAAAQAAGAIVAPVTAELAAAFAGDPSLFSADRYHPSSAGYARIAAAVAPYLITAAGAADGKRPAA